jgi:hypothetical protein
MAENPVSGEMYVSPSQRMTISPVATARAPFSAFDFPPWGRSTTIPCEYCNWEIASRASSSVRSVEPSLPTTISVDPW